MKKEYYPEKYGAPVFEKPEKVEMDALTQKEKPRDYVAVYLKFSSEKEALSTLKILGVDSIDFQQIKSEEKGYFIMLSCPLKLAENLPAEILIERPESAPVWFGVND
jgi:hypothetical protein